MTDAQKNLKIRLEIPSDADDDTYESGIQEHCGIPWSLEMRLRPNQTDIELTCREDDDESRNYEWGVCAKVQAFLLLDDEEVSVGPKETVKFYVDRTAKFYMKQDVESRLREYLKENNAVIEVRGKIKSMFGTVQQTLEDFSKEEAGWTDLTLKAGEKTFHVNKATLSRASPVFRAMLSAASEGPTPCSELLLDNTDPKVFEYFLQMCHGRTPRFEVGNVKHILKLADQYDVPNVRVLCEKHLMTMDETLNMNKAIKIADKFEFHNLLLKHLRFLETVECFEELEPMIDSLSSKSLTIVLRKLAAVKKENIKNQLLVRTKDTMYTLMIHPKETVADVTERIAKIEGNPVERQRLQVNGRHLTPRKRIHECINPKDYWQSFHSVLSD